MHTSQVGVGKGHLANQRTTAGQEVHHTVRKTSLLVNLHQQVVRQHSRRAGFPDAHIAHQHRRQAQVAGNGSEVKRSDGKDEALQRAVRYIVQRALVAAGLVAVDLRGVVGVVAQEVNQLACRVNLSLHGSLALAKHRGGINQVAVLSADERGNLQHHAGTVNPRGVGPLLMSLHGCGNGGLHLFLAYFVVLGQYVLVVGGHDDFAHLGGLHLLATDNGADSGGFLVQVFQGFADLFALGAAGLVT